MFGKSIKIFYTRDKNFFGFFVFKKLIASGWF